jgi:hypothetical protein
MSRFHTSEDPVPLRPVATAIATTYDASPAAFSFNDFNTVALEIDLTLATATDVRIMVELANPARGPNGAYVAPVAADWYPISVAGTATAATPITSVPYQQREITITATGKYTVVLNGLIGKFIRVKAKTTGGPGATTLGVDGVFGAA